MVLFQVIAWDAGDVEDKYTVTAYGRSSEGDSVSLSCLFQPYFFVRSADTKAFQKFGHVSIVEAKDLWGFQNAEKSRFVKITFESHKSMKQAQWNIQKRMRVYEANIDPMLRFMHRTGISSTGWIDTGSNCIKSYNTKCTIDLFCQDWKTLKPVDRDDIAPLRISSFDIECFSADGSFPAPEKDDNVVFQIAVTTKVFGKSGWLDRTCLCLKQTSAYDAVSFSTEKELLEAFAKHLQKIDPDILTGWNIFGFDLEYLYKRMSIAGCSPESYVWGRYKDRPVELVTKNLTSGALGSNVLKMVPMTGRYTFDLFHDVKREHKLESYSLNAVSKVFLGDQKNDMPVKEIFSRYAEGDPTRLGEVAEYCLKDTELPHQIMIHLCTIQNLIEMAKATWVPLAFLSERGQQIKVFSQMAKKARELGFMIPTIPYKKDAEASEEGYQGATVLDAQAGAYYGPVTALDFASLYPSIMVAHNLCYSTLVMDPKYDNLPGVQYEQFGQWRFAQNCCSLLPAILTELKQFRKKAKKDMAAAEGTQMEAVYNGKQLAYKISMNSVYGFTGATGGGMLPLVAIASTVTMRGRQMIEETKEFVEANFQGAHVRYGDSVMPGTPVLVKINGKVSVSTIESLGELWLGYPGFLKDGTDKEQSDVNMVESWTHEGWKHIKRVIRHKCKKKIYRVLTHTGVVDVTEDHSLLSPSIELLKPTEVKIGQKLFHSFPEEFTEHNNTSYEEAFIYGMFVGDGSCGMYDCPSGKKATWAINNADLDLLEKCKTMCTVIHPDYEFVIMDTMKSSGVYKLSPRGGSVIELAEMYRQRCYDGQAKKIPELAFGNKQAFLDGLWESDGCRKDNEKGCHRIDTKNQITAQWYYMFLRSMGYRVSLNTRKDKLDVFRLTWTSGKFRKDAEAIKKIDILHESWDGYVYDIETEAGTFQAGVGQMIVKNTDSVMVEFDVGDRKGQEAIEYSWDQGVKAADACTKLFKQPNELELEKVYCPYFLYSKKRYAAKMYEKDRAGNVVFKKIDVKGLQVVRRDNCPYVREVCKNVLGHILNGSDPMPAIKEAKQAAKKLLAGDVPMEKLMMSKQLAGNYKSDNHAHVSVRDKIRKRAPGSEPQQGDRVQYVIIEGPKNAKLYEKAEDPAWVTENGIKLDYKYYFTNQLKNPITDLLEPLIGTSTDIFSDSTSRCTTIHSYFTRL